MVRLQQISDLLHSQLLLGILLRIGYGGGTGDRAFVVLASLFGDPSQPNSVSSFIISLHWWHLLSLHWHMHV